MRAVKLQLATRTLLNPAAPQWAKAPAEEISLGGTPLHLQPTRYIRTAWAARPIGTVRRLTVQAAHNKRDIAFRLEWPDDTEDRDYRDGSHFPDAAGVVFPLQENAPLETMGSPEAPVNVWYWRANMAEGEAEELVSTGLGIFADSAADSIQSRATWQGGRWQVVLTRPLSANGQGVPLSPGMVTGVAFAVWEGSNQERAGLLSFSKHWRDLEIA